VRTKLKPATGTVQWVDKLDLKGRGILAINDVEYLLSPIVDNGKLLGWNLDKEDGTQYHIDLTDQHGPSCSCADACFRQERTHACKHVLGTKAALRAISNPEPIIFGNAE
jgi:hypothetical protein